MADNAIELDNLTKAFGQDTVLKGVTRGFERGKIHGVVGNNGSGKTVMFKCICGFLQPSAGTVHVDGKQIGVEVDFPPDIGIIIESPGFLPQLSGLKNLEILAGLKRKIGLKEVADTIRQVGLDPLSAKPVGKMLGEYGHEQIARGGSLVLYDAESSDKWELTLNKFLRGLALAIESGVSVTIDAESGYIDTSDVDAECADLIIQFALFGDLVFG